MREIQQKGTYDVAVAGGGVAGIAAALAATRQGKKVLLLEKQFMLGGLATAGLITIYLPICDGMGRQVSFGLAEELLRLSVKEGAEDTDGLRWIEGKGPFGEKDGRFQTRFNPQLFAILAEQQLTQEGVDILYGAWVCDVEKEGKKIARLIVQGKEGRFSVAVKSVVDATGDGDVAYLADAPCALFEKGNILAAWYYGNGQDGYHLTPLGYAEIPDEEVKERGQVELLSQKRFTGLTTEDNSDMMMLAHAQILNKVKEERKKDKTYFPVTMATVPQLRMTRRICGEYTLKTEEMHTEFKDSVGLISNWKKRGPVYEVPFGTLYSKEVPNLLCAGRCTSVNDPMWDIMRVIPCCAVTGEAAGIAAAMSDDMTALSIEALQNQLKKAGVVLHERDL